MTHPSGASQQAQTSWGAIDVSALKGVVDKLSVLVEQFSTENQKLKLVIGQLRDKSNALCVGHTVVTLIGNMQNNPNNVIRLDGNARFSTSGVLLTPEAQGQTGYAYLRGQIGRYFKISFFYRVRGGVNRGDGLTLTLRREDTMTLPLPLGLVHLDSKPLYDSIYMSLAEYNNFACLGTGKDPVVNRVNLENPGGEFVHVVFTVTPTYMNIEYGEKEIHTRTRTFREDMWKSDAGIGIYFHGLTGWATNEHEIKDLVIVTTDPERIVALYQNM